MRIGVTGGIGCGKSTVVAELHKLLPYAALFDFDASVRALYGNTLFQQGLRRAFGTDKREEVAAIVFSSPAAMHELNEMTRTPLLLELRHRTAAAPLALVEFPLLLETAWDTEHFDLIVAITCDEATQKQRVAARDGASADKISRVLGGQFSTSAKAALADIVIDTSVGAPALSTQLAPVLRAVRLDALRQRALKDFPTLFWEAIAQAYSEPHRHYHGLSHLSAMFREYDRVRHLLNYPEAVSDSIWLHDFRMDVDLAAYSANEARSAKAYLELSRDYAPRRLAVTDEHEGGLRYGRVGLVAEFIMCTKGHQVNSPFLQAHPKALADAKLFLDIDLSILSAPADECDTYDANIRKEFAAVPEKFFASERARVLRNFLERERIYLTDVFAPREDIARDNLRRLIARWEAVAATAPLAAIAH